MNKEKDKDIVPSKVWSEMFLWEYHTTPPIEEKGKTSTQENDEH